MIAKDEEMSQQLTELVRIVRTLRGPGGCEWDRAQNSKSLVPYLLEEAHELIESIDNNAPKKVKEELGDLLLHIVFQAVLGEEQNQFNLTDSIRHINEKLIRRHPHVFAETPVDGIKDIKKNWEEIKLKEGRASLMEGLPKTLPALLLARRVQERASQVGFDWTQIEPVWGKIEEELAELHQAIDSENRSQIKEEIGDLLFSIVNLSRFIELDPEKALRLTVLKFIQRFQYIEKELEASGIKLKDASLEEMDNLWNKTKTNGSEPHL